MRDGQVAVSGSFTCVLIRRSTSALDWDAPGRLEPNWPRQPAARRARRPTTTTVPIQSGSVPCPPFPLAAAAASFLAVFLAAACRGRCSGGSQGVVSPKFESDLNGLGLGAWSEIQGAVGLVASSSGENRWSRTRGSKQCLFGFSSASYCN